MDKSTKRLMVYDTDWQVIRVGTLSQNRSDGGWGSVAGVKLNIEMLRFYLNCALDAEDKQRRLYRIINMLNATRMGYNGTGLVGSEQDALVIGLRDELQAEANELQRNLGENWLVDVRTMYIDESRKLHTLFVENEEVFMQIYTNLSSRLRKHSSSIFRGELRWYVQLMESVKQQYEW